MGWDGVGWVKMMAFSGPFGMPAMAAMAAIVQEFVMGYVKRVGRRLSVLTDPNWQTCKEIRQCLTKLSKPLSAFKRVKRQ